VSRRKLERGHDRIAFVYTSFDHFNDSASMSFSPWRWLRPSQKWIATTRIFNVARRAKIDLHDDGRVKSPIRAYFTSKRTRKRPARGVYTRSGTLVVLNTTGGGRTRTRAAATIEIIQRLRCNAPTTTSSRVRKKLRERSVKTQFLLIYDRLTNSIVSVYVIK